LGAGGFRRGFPRSGLVEPGLTFSRPGLRSRPLNGARPPLGGGSLATVRRYPVNGGRCDRKRSHLDQGGVCQLRICGPAARVGRIKSKRPDLCDGYSVSPAASRA
jgi:hypothetical protein